MLYHTEVCWPKRIRNKLPFGVRSVSYSNHAIKASKDDRYGSFVLPQSVDLHQAQIFEAEETSKNKPLDKIVFRYPMGDGRSLVVAAIPRKRGLFVKTVWINVDSDNHQTLDKNKYFKG
jgi:hypothetical protein